MDNKTKEQRSKNMSLVKNKNTDLEILLRKELWKAGFRYRIKNKLPGKPDIIFPSLKIAIFCDGCLWHGCPKCNHNPEQNREFWEKKIQQNKERDRFVKAQLESQGWTVLRFWGCEIKKELPSVIDKIASEIRKKRG